MKKKTAKKHTPKLEKVDLIKVERIPKRGEVVFLDEHKMLKAIAEVNSRIDRIVRAIDKSKSVRGL